MLSLFFKLWGSKLNVNFFILGFMLVGKKSYEFDVVMVNVGNVGVSCIGVIVVE